MTFPIIATPGTNAPLSSQNAPRPSGAANTTDAGTGFGGLLDLGNASQPKITGNNGAALGTTLGGLKGPAAANFTIALPTNVPEQQVPASNIELNFETPETAQLEAVTLNTPPTDGETVGKIANTAQSESLPPLASMAAGKNAVDLSGAEPTSPEGSTEANDEVGQNTPMTDEPPKPVPGQNSRADDNAEGEQRETKAQAIQTPLFDAPTIEELAAKPAELAAVAVPAAIAVPKSQSAAPDRTNAGPANGRIEMASDASSKSGSAQPKQAGQASLASATTTEMSSAERISSQPPTGSEEFATELADADGPGAPRIEAMRFSSASTTGEIRGTATANAAEPSGSARAEQIGRDVGVEIARHVRNGQDEFSVRMDPAELGRIQIRLAFDDQGHLRAHVSADSQAAMELLRRDSGELGRALSDAGVRTDSQSFRFSGGEQSGMGGRQGQNDGDAARENAGQINNETEMGDGDELAAYQNVRAAGRINIMA